jgi:tetratricopeptide (TPR) repeat protein
VTRDRDRDRENRRVFAAGAVVAALVVVAWLVLGALRRPAGVAVPFAAATATPVVSDQAKAEAAALLEAALLRFAEGQPGTALELSDQALEKWPQYEAAQRFAATAVPQATAVEHTAQVRATAAAMAAAQAGLARAQASADARRVYSSRAGLALQRYADALGLFWEKHRQARERPELVRDAEWRFRTAAALETMQRAAAELTALRPVPPDLAAAAALFAQLADETTQVGQDYARGLAGPEATGVPFPSTRLDRASDLLRQANVEVRRAVPVAPAGP